ncbi:dTDP-4-dehydrorhamnose reductase [Thiomicrorhabdus sediminis]|uniref:dTDP-4-dehydrorhamnose reductase n=1 Tax=Thiomicrorhabdus sediminis TaxID=2580412 RepID=A0A4P9K3V8_9GAMM|nr:dTDP-4-dehydrorhamnose reductase [Thiomicrorhabdus sediminis]QCU89558.1 dTDP-4-dehydrorhamnose reductase [Thiomicrorhabdus sediminis]
MANKVKLVLVTGKNGQLGKSLHAIATNNQKDYSEYAFTYVGRDEMDLSDSQSIDAFFQNQRFDIIINCAAYTAVDKAESEVELADKINHLAVKQLAEIAKQKNSFLMHISTDYVFDGKSCHPYGESDPVAPQGIYGVTKLNGEQAIQTVNPKGAILRTSWVYSEFGSNFVKTMLRLGAERDSLNVIFDQVGSPTYARDLAKTILQMVKKAEILEHNSIYHYSNEGVCSWYDFAKAIFEISKADCLVTPIETKDYHTPAKRPHYSLMNKAKIKADFGMAIPYWRDSLMHCLTELKK